MQSLWTSLSGLKASDNWLNRVSNNLANSNTVGFAADEGSFADMLTGMQTGNPLVNAQAGRLTPPGWWGGTGVLSTNNEKDFAAMPLQRTDNPTDLAIDGNGFFVVGAPDGSVHLTKAGNFGWSKASDGTFFLATPGGEPVLDTNGRRISVGGTGNHNLSVGPNGAVTVDNQPTGQTIAIAEVALSGQKLDSVGNNEYAVKAGVAPQIVNRGGSATSSSKIEQGALAMSNVDMTVELTDMIQAQRMFDLNSQALSLTNRMMGDANHIRN